MRARRKRLTILAAMVLLIVACAAVIAVRASQPRYHYEVRRDLSVYFANADSVIEKLRECLKRRQEIIRISYSAHNSSLDDLDELTRELMGFACTETDRPDEGDYLGCQIGGYNADFSEQKRDGENACTIEIRPIYFTDEEQEEAVSREVGEVLERLELAEGSSDEEKVRAVYGYICDNVSYDTIHRKNDSHRLRSTAYGALCYKRATCLGYAVTVYRLLRELGVECRVVTGTAKGEYHAWNVICIDGLWYNADATWDSMNGGRDFFLKCPDDFPEHEREEKFSSESFAAACPMAERSL